MGKVITFGIQKGGSGKTSTSAVVAYLLAKSGYKVLAVDLDSQGNMSELLTMKESSEFKGRSISEALEDEDIKGKVVQFADNPNLHLVPANDDLSAFPDYALLNFLDLDESGRVQFDKESGTPLLKPEVNWILKRTLDKVKNRYHYIILDTPPNLSRIVTNALAASDSVVVVYETARFCYGAVKNFLETIHYVQETSNPNLHLAGILPNLVDKRIANHRAYINKAKKQYGDLVFDQVIYKRASIGKLPDTGFIEDNKLYEDLSFYSGFIEELFKRVNRGR